MSIRQLCASMGPYFLFLFCYSIHKVYLFYICYKLYSLFFFFSHVPLAWKNRDILKKEFFLWSNFFVFLLWWTWRLNLVGTQVGTSSWGTPGTHFGVLFWVVGGERICFSRSIYSVGSLRFMTGVIGANWVLDTLTGALK